MINRTLIRPNSFLRIGGSCQELIECLPELGPVLVQARNHGGGLGKLVSSVSPMILDGFSDAYDPENNFGFSLDELVAVHATAKRKSDPRDTDSLDFEFGSFTAGVSLLEISGISETGTIRRFAGQFGGTAISPKALDRWRTEIQPPLHLCKECGAAAERRARSPEGSPLFLIFDYASRSGIPLTCRILGDHVDFTVEMLPGGFSSAGGYLVVHDREGQAVLHLDLRFVHAFSINRITVDDQKRAALSIYDMHGNRNFEISSPVPELASVWRAISESADSLYTSGEGRGL